MTVSNLSLTLTELLQPVLPVTLKRLSYARELLPDHVWFANAEEKQ
jgi:hypothetical protein